VLLDIMMPGLSGIEVCKRLREDASTRGIPVIMLSAASHRENRIRAFDLGADDFLPKPFDAEELLSRINAKLRHFADEKEPAPNQCGNLRLDPESLSAQVEGDSLTLSAVEFDILRILVEKQERLVPRAEFVRKIWKNSPNSDRLIDAHLVALRRHLESFSGEIRTVYGRGYLLSATKKNSSRNKNQPPEKKHV
jgi:DNA-binding response OmpR family regulator